MKFLVRLSRTVLAGLVISLLASCGGADGGSSSGDSNGGNSGGSAPAPVQTPQAPQAPQTPQSTAAVLSLLAGNAFGPGNADGTPGAFNAPNGTAVDSHGNVYVADVSTQSIRKITPAGVVSTLAGGTRGSADGTGAAAQFYYPSGVAVDGAGNVYVADARNNTIRKITPAGVVTTVAGTAGASGYTNGTGAAARFSYPSGVAVDGSGNLFVTDQNNAAVRQITPAGAVSTVVDGTTAPIYTPTDVALDSLGTLYVSDGNTILKITSGGVVTTLAGGSTGSSDGTGAAAQFSGASGVSVDGAGNVYVADANNNTIRKITSGGAVTTVAGTAGSSGRADGTGSAARFNDPSGVAVDASGNLYVADQSNSTIRKITTAGVVSTMAGTVTQAGSTDGTGSAALFKNPSGVAADSAGNLYVVDTYNNTIRKITPTGVTSTFAGTAGSTGSQDGTGAAAQFDFPIGVALDSADNLYVADSGNNTIRKITPSGVVSTLAGSPGGRGANQDGTGAAAGFNNPMGVAVDGAGNVYVADTNNHTIRKITPAAVVTTLAGSALQFGAVDGTGSAARFRTPRGVAVDSAGNVYVGDTSNNLVRKITPAGVVSTAAGSAGAGGTPGQAGSTDGTAAAALFKFPTALTVDGTGNVYVADAQNNTIRKITAAGAVTTVVGTVGVMGFTPGALPGGISRNIGGVALVGTTLYFTQGNSVAQVTNRP